MEKLKTANKFHVMTAMFIFLITTVSACLVFLIFIPDVKKVKQEIDHRQKTLSEYHELLIRKQGLASEWEAKKSFFNPSAQPEEVMNSWLKDILTYAQSQSLTLEKLEPAGIKDGEDGKEHAVFISFQGDIRKFVQFIYHLMEVDPLARIDSLFMRQEEGEKALLIELMLGKAQG